MMDADQPGPVIGHALQASREGRNREALALLEGAIRPETDATFWALLGDLYASEERYSEAIAAFDRAIEKKPNLAGAFSGLGRAYRELGQLAPAAQALQTSVGFEPTAARLIMLGDVQAALGQERLARHSFEQAARLDPQNEEAPFNLALLLRAEDPARAAKLLDRAVLIAPDFAKGHREIGFAFLQSGKLSDAQTSLSRALLLDPNDPWAHVYCALLAEVQGRIETAVEHLRRAREYAITEGYPRYFLGNLYARVGKWTQAEEEFRKAIETDPRDPEPLFHLARFLVDAGRRPEARAVLELALGVDPSHEPSASLLQDCGGF